MRNRTRYAPWLVLGAAILISATWMLIAGNGLTFTNDDSFYYVQYVAQGFSEIEPMYGLEYFFAPSNGHLQVGGKLLYRAIFEISGANYFVFRAVNVAGVMICVGLFFELARRRVGDLAALAGGISLLFLGFAWENFLWAFDLHTIYALAFGLGAILALQRDDWRGDVAACGLLILSIAMIELGLAFAAGIAISVLMRPDRLRRAWIFLTPLALYGCWWVWSRQFDQPDVLFSNVRLIPSTVIDALAAVLGSIFGVNPTGPGVPQPLTDVTPWGTAMAAFVLIALAARIARGSVPRTLWVFLGVVLAYWSLIALGDRAPDSSRYIFVGALLVLLVTADALADRPLPRPALIAAFCVVALAIPPNVAKLYDGRGPQLADATRSRVEYAMLDLVWGPIQPDYAPGKDPRVVALGGNIFTPLPAGDYLEAAHRFGPLGMPIDEIPGQSLQLREIADASLIGALRLALGPVSRPVRYRNCPSALGGRPGHGVYFFPPQAGFLLGSQSKHEIEVAVGRFGSGGSGVELGKLGPERWAKLALPRDSAPDRWWVAVDGPVYACALNGDPGEMDYPG